MRIVFMGTPQFAVPSLDLLLNSGVEVVAVVTAPDKPAGRGRQLQCSDVKRYALEKGLKILQPMNLKDPAFLNELRVCHADLHVVVAFRMLPEAVWNMPELGTYNLHASLLPSYRGAAPINWAIINGEKETGVTTFRLKHAIDSGKIVLQERQVIGPDTTAGELHDLLMEKGAQVLLKTIRLIEECKREGKDVPFIQQDEQHVSHAPKLSKETCRINWNSDARSIQNLIRGLSPYPAAFTTFTDPAGKTLQLKIFSSSFESTSDVQLANGSLFTESDNTILVKCGGGVLRIKELQLEGKKRMQAEAFLMGYKFKKGLKLDKGN